MFEQPLAALFKALKKQLGGTALCGDNVFAEIISADYPRPNFIYVLMAGGEDNFIRDPDASYVLSVRCLADDLDTAVQGAAILSGLLNDTGQQDQSLRPLDNISGQKLDAGPDWIITTSTKQPHEILFPETIDNARVIWHAGAQFRFIMGRV